MILSRLRARRLEPELMDQPGLDHALHTQALRALARVNVLSLSAWRAWSAVRRVARLYPDRPVRVLDVACGGGDIAIGIAQRARRAGLPVEVAGCDLSELALAHASDASRAAGLSIDWFVLDVESAPIPSGFDLLCCSLFLHHLEEAAAVAFLASMERAAPHVHLQDLRRTATGFALAWATLRLISRSTVAHTDGPRSVSAAFTLAEVHRLTRAAGLRDARIGRCWPQRFVLEWDAAA